MKITFLGTCHGAQESGRHLSATMLEINNAVYFIDAGAPMAELVQNKGIPHEKIKAMFITHMHGDHFWGSFSLLSMINWAWKDMNIQVVLPEDRAMTLLQQVLLSENSTIDKERIHLHLWREVRVYEDENLKVTAIPNGHGGGKLSSYSFLIEAEGKKLLFTGDLTRELSDFPVPAFEEQLDLIVCEYAHSVAEYMEPTVARCRTKRLYFNHVFPKTKFAEIEQMNVQFPFEIRAVNDDDELIL